MAWWVYEDDSTNWVRVHAGACRFCNDGRGVYPDRLPVSRWHGPFETKQAAIGMAASTGRKDAAGCGICLPDVGSLR